MNVSEESAKAELERLLDIVQSGGEVVIERDGTPVARLVRVGEIVKRPRRPGAWKGRVWMADDEEMAKVDRYIAALFNGDDVDPDFLVDPPPQSSLSRSRRGTRLGNEASQSHRDALKRT